MPRREPGEPYYRLTVDEAGKMHGKPDTMFIDVRKPDEYRSGHVKNATLIPVDDVLAKVDDLPRDKNLVFICAVGARSGLACEMAAAMGLDQEKLFSVDGGTPVWIQKGLPTSRGNEP
ncbi:MAG: rhodanese-like domain-containing protein [SAR202 cluster bacterium]|nr:rhodanese-like domain-containing protein [SAR202 cluster bacterium]